MGQVAQALLARAATWSPGARPCTPAPISSTTPAPSWPGTTGHGISTDPSIAFRSSLHTPLACSRTRTSPRRGGASSSSTTRSGVPAAGRSAARVVTTSDMRGSLHELLQAPLEPALADLALLERKAQRTAAARSSGVGRWER
jgi:hypothetical protein